MNNIFLLGYMGSGKSTVAKKIARKMDYNWIDLDTLIQEQQGASISAIFDKEGEEAFRLMEQQALYSCSNINDTIVSLGGGTPCFFDNMEWIKNNSISVYLKMPAKVLLNRLQNAKQHRPLLESKDEFELLKFIQQQLGEREKYYLQADIIYPALSVSLEQLIQEINNQKNR